MTFLVKNALQWAQQELVNANIEQPVLEARMLLAFVLQCQRESLLAASLPPLTPLEYSQFQAVIRQRQACCPLSKIIGQKEFWSLPFETSLDTLDPRPDSEIIIEALLKWAGHLKEKPYTILDLGTGSGCLLLAALSEFKCMKGIGVDISPAALRIAQRNADKLHLAERVQFFESNWGQAVKGRFPIILCNPPYIPRESPLPRDVQEYDPPQALFGGPDGLSAYRQLALDIPLLLATDGFLFLEIGQGQAQAIQAIFEPAGLSVFSIEKDLAGIERVMVLTHARR